MRVATIARMGEPIRAAARALPRPRTRGKQRALMFFLTPRHVKHGRAFLKDARKLLAYKRDLWSDVAVADFESGISALEAAVKSREVRRIEESAHRLDTLAGQNVKPVTDAGWRENCEVFLVAIVIALGVRTYFLQPFTIPTGSMQPTLNGLIGYKTETPPPNLAVRLVHLALFGRTYIDVVAKTDDVIIEIREVKKFGLLTRTLLRGERESYMVDCPRDTLERYLLAPLHPFKAGEIIARGYYNTGDHVFVDKFSYHFSAPDRGDVFVFNTQNIPTRENQQTLMQGPSQYYIKRLAGLPGDLLQIRPPELLVNGSPAKGRGFERVMSVKNGYRGYSNESETPPDAGGHSMRFRMNLLGSPEETFRVPDKNYFALGDNSFHSSDSRDWGRRGGLSESPSAVPQQNIMGRGVLVYWPFTSHWGLIR